MKIKIWETKIKEKVDVMIDENNHSWVDKKDFDYLYVDYRILVKTNMFLLFCLMIFAFAYIWSLC